MGKEMQRESTTTLMVTSMMANGRMISEVARVELSEPTVAN